MAENGGDVEQGRAVQVAPTDVELERAIASVPGVVSAGIDRSNVNGRSRMRLRLAPGEDEEAVAWAVAATLRERFGIALDPDAIRARPTTDADPAQDPVRLVHTGDGAADPGEADGDHGPRAKLADELAETRERLRLAAARALEGVADLADVAELADIADMGELAELIDLPIDASGGPSTDAPTGSVTAMSDVTDVTDVTDVSDVSETDASDVDPTDDTSVAITADGDEGREAATGPREQPTSSARAIIPRAAIRDLQVQRDARSVQVTVVLAHGERTAEGRAQSVPTSHGALRAVAEATVAALRVLTEGSLLVGIDRVSVKHGDDAPIATVVLSLLTRRGEERLLGASMVRDGPERAILRATLDALNRRVTPLLVEPDDAPR